MGDEALRIEILALFLTEIERLLGQVEAAGEAARRAERLHAVTGLARNIGAVRLGEVARDLERRVSRAPQTHVDLEPLRAAVREVVEHVRSGA